MDVHLGVQHGLSQRLLQLMASRSKSNAVRHRAPLVQQVPVNALIVLLLRLTSLPRHGCFVWLANTKILQSP
jgi:hypothetical protein